MSTESLAELNAIGEEHQERPEVLQLRLHHLMRRKHWTRALSVSRKLCRVAPNASAGFLHAGFCLHQIGRTLEAKKLLLKRANGTTQGTNLLLQHGLLRSVARQPGGRTSASPYQFQNGRVLSRAGQERSRSKAASRHAVVAVAVAEDSVRGVCDCRNCDHRENLAVIDRRYEAGRLPRCSCPTQN